MNRNAIRIIVLMGCLSTLSIIIGQSYWLRQAFDLREKQFSHSVYVALNTVASELIESNKDTTVNVEAIRQLANNYFSVEFNSNVNFEHLEEFLINEFQKNNIPFNFEYAIFECSKDSFIYGNYVDLKNISKPRRINIPDHHKQHFYFGILFPQKSPYMMKGMRAWIFITAILFLVIIFFGYAIYIIFKEKRISEIKNDFINNMTHELKTPISTISISSEMLLKPETLNKPERLTRYAEIINEESNRLKNLVESVLKISVMDGNKFSFNFEKNDLTKIIEDVVNNFRLHIEENEGVINFETNPAEVITLVDKEHFTNVINNLLDNAIKYNQQTPIIYINLRIVEEKIHLSISDNGIGIDKKEIKHLFEKFYRVPHGNIHNVKGYGIGLYYVKKVVEAHKGEIKVLSKKDKGTTFTIKMPLKK